MHVQTVRWFRIRRGVSFFDGAAQIGQGKKFGESRLLPMLRTLLAFSLRRIILGLELKPQFNKKSHAWRI
jgi:hypothetical protein